MKNLAFFFILLLIFSSCRKNAVPKSSANGKIIVKNAEKYIGTPYKFGGSETDGMDCSGLVFRVFEDLETKIPRVSYKQADHFKEIKLEHAIPGDLVYFKVGSSRINHTGIISDIKGPKEILFIHASTTKGVREDNLFSKYWYPKFVKVTRPHL
ncbi:MAG: C40 family peptidase [Cytophagaceae bacterium]|nr:C40 family peptidase [Cytophagaceae bacterium]